MGLFVAAGIALIVLVGIGQRVDGWWQPKKHQPLQRRRLPGQSTLVPCIRKFASRLRGDARFAAWQLVPAASGAADLDEFSVKIEPAQRRLANIETAKVESGALEDTVRTVGAIAIDESRQATISAYIDGRLERSIRRLHGGSHTQKAII